MKRYLTYEEAVALLPDGEYIHTFTNPGFGLMGCDCERAEILNMLWEKEVIELTGEQARSLGHGMCVYNKDTKWQSEIVFIEIDPEKLNAFDQGEKDEEVQG